MCVIGASAPAFAARIAARMRERGEPASTLRVELRHAEGALLEGDADRVLRAHPDALASEVAAARPDAPRAITVGAGVALAAAARPDLLVWIRGGESLLALGPAERALASEAHLVLEEPREDTATALADSLLAALAIG